MSVDRRSFLQSSAAATAAALAWPGAQPSSQSDLAPIFAQIEKRHDESVARLQEWIHQPSIAAENRGVNEGCELTMRLLREAGFDQVTKIPTDGQPGIFATLDAGAPRTLGLYFMYDVKQADPAEWSSPPWTAALVDRPGMGKVLIGRGAVNQKGPEGSFLAALHALRALHLELHVHVVARRVRVGADLLVRLLDQLGELALRQAFVLDAHLHGEPEAATVARPD